MTNLKDLEKVGRNALLATIGTYAKGWEIISGKVTETFDDTNKLVNDLIENGEKIEADFKDKIQKNTYLDDKLSALKVKLGVDTSTDDKIAELYKKVDVLTDEISKLVDAKLEALESQQQEITKAETKEATKTTKATSTVKRKVPAKKAAQSSSTSANAETQVTTSATTNAAVKTTTRTRKAAPAKKPD